MKIKLLTKGLTTTELDTLNKGVAQCVALIPQLQFTHETTTANFTAFPISNEVVTGVVLDATALLSLVDGTDDIVCLVYDWNLITPRPTNPATSLIKKGNTIPMAIPKQWFSNYPEVFVQFFLHELCHAQAFRTGKQDLTHSFYTSTYSQKSPTDYYLYLLKEVYQVTYVTSQTYDFFSQKEVEKYKLTPQLWQILDKARKIANTQFIITSGYRTIQENKKAGGKANSAHLRGMACDILCIDNKKRTKILKGLLNCGSPLFIEVAKKHIHIDIDSSIHDLDQLITEEDD